MKQVSSRKRIARRGFTIVELVIVIAVIGILATVLVPTFGDVISSAKDSSAKQAAKNAYTEYLVDAAANGSIAEYCVYQADAGRFVAIKNGAVVGVFGTQDEALAAMVNNPTEDLVDSGDGKLFIYGGVAGDNSGGSSGEAVPETDWSGASAVFVGDSITAGSGTDKIYYQYLKEMLRLGTVTGNGIGGSCYSAKSDYGTNNTPLINRYQSVPSADLIVIFMGTNDYGHETPLGNPSDSGDISFYGALNTILPAMQAAHPNSQLVVMTPLHRYGFGTSASTGTAFTYDTLPNGRGHTLADYVNAIKDVCQKNEIAVIDLFDLVTLDPTDAQVRAAYMPDGLHPNAAGHEIVAEIIAAELKKIPCKEGSGEADEPEAPDYSLRTGNRFGGASFETATNRICTTKNLYLRAGTIITLKDNDNYDWAVSKETSATSTNTSGYCFSDAWDTAGYQVVTEDGWYGFTIKKSNDANFDLGGTDSNDLQDYFVIAEQVTMESGNRFANGFATADRLSASFDLYLPAGTTITLKAGTEAAGFGIYFIENGAANLQGGGWLTEPFTVSKAGYYGFALKTSSGNFSDDTHTLFQYLNISGYPHN